jgi:hypothetical protein
MFWNFLEELAKKFPIFKEPKFLTLNSQNPAIEQYTEREEFSPHSHTSSLPPICFCYLLIYLCIRFCHLQHLVSHIHDFNV